MSNDAMSWAMISIEMSAHILEKDNNEGDDTLSVLAEKIMESFTDDDEKLATIDFNEKEYLSLLMLAKITSEMLSLNGFEYMEDTNFGMFLASKNFSLNATEEFTRKLSIAFSCWTDYLESYASGSVVDTWNTVKSKMSRDRMSRFFELMSGVDDA